MSVRSNGKKATNSILSFLELSRRLQKDGSDNELIKVTDKLVNDLKQSEDMSIAIESLPELIDKLELKMNKAAKDLNFEEAAILRDRIHQLRKKLVR